MKYFVGQKICLWEMALPEPGSGTLRVVREVMVTITDTKTGAPGHFSRNPTTAQSLRGTGDDGKTYEKHWESWPESQLNDFMDQWSLRDDGQSLSGLWAPMEAVSVYNGTTRFNRQELPKLLLLGNSGEQIKPSGDVTYCEKHDRYSHRGTECYECKIEAVRAA